MSGRFMLFGGTNYYPTGGGLDYLSAHDTLDDAVAALPEHPADVAGSGYGCQWAHVFDAEQERIVRAWQASYGARDEDEVHQRQAESANGWPELEVSRWVELDPGEL